MKARVVEQPEAYGWRSRVYCFKKLSLPDFLDTSFLLGLLDDRERAARKAMREFVQAGRTGRLPDPFKRVKGAAILGDEAFVQWVQAKFLKGRRKDRDLPGLKELKRLELGQIRDLVEHSINNDAMLARKVGIYLCRKFSERTLAEIGQFYGGMGVSAVSQTVQRLESQRQRDKQLDNQLKYIENKIRMYNV